MKLKIRCKCDNCGKIVLRHKYRFKKSKLHFCNRKCLSENNIGKKRLPYRKIAKIKVKCDNCKKHIIKRVDHFKKQLNKFCSRKCFHEWRFNHSRVSVKCGYCLNTVIRIKSHKNRNDNQFCSLKCMGRYYSKHHIGENSPNYIHGNSTLSYPTEFNKFLKDNIRHRDGYKCVECEVPQKELINALDVHHIDYDKENNDGINLISLCKTCHMKTNGNRKYWQNHYEQVQIDRKVHLLDIKLEMEEAIE